MATRSGSGTDGRNGHPDSPDAAGIVGGPGRELSGWLGTGALPPEVGEPLRSPGGLSGRLADTAAAQEGRVAELVAQGTAREGRVAGLLAQVTALTARITQLERDLYGPRPDRLGKGSDVPSGKDGGGGGDGRRRGGRPGRRKERGDSVGDAGLRPAERPRFPASP